MPLEDRDAAYLWDMLQAANEVVEMIGDHDLDSFLRNHILQRAIERCVEIIGEVARRVSDPGRAATPEIPWREIIGQRGCGQSRARSPAREYAGIREKPRLAIYY